MRVALDPPPNAAGRSRRKSLPGTGLPADPAASMTAAASVQDPSGASAGQATAISDGTSEAKVQNHARVPSLSAAGRKGSGNSAAAAHAVPVAQPNDAIEPALVPDVAQGKT